MFEDDLGIVMEQWQSKGDCIILLMDANNNVFNDGLTKVLKNKLDMQEAVRTVVPGQGHFGAQFAASFL